MEPHARPVAYGDLVLHLAGKNRRVTAVAALVSAETGERGPRPRPFSRQRARGDLFTDLLGSILSRWHFDSAGVSDAEIIRRFRSRPDVKSSSAGSGVSYPMDGAYGRIRPGQVVVVSAPCVDGSGSVQCKQRRHPAHNCQTTGSRRASRAAASAPTARACVTFPASGLRTTSCGFVSSRSLVGGVRDEFPSRAGFTR